VGMKVISHKVMKTQTASWHILRPVWTGGHLRNGYIFFMYYVYLCVHVYVCTRFCVFMYMCVCMYFIYLYPV
jgi:hypothetical protein